MASRNVYQKLGYRISEEVQLLAEEKWIVEALAQIKNQRNCLQIERLHLESLKAKLKVNSKIQKHDEQKLNMEEDGSASTSAVNLMQNVTCGKVSEKTDDMSEDFCNNQELNLIVSTPAYMKSCGQNDDFNMEEDEESDDDTFIDMNMLMNGKLK